MSYWDKKPRECVDCGCPFSPDDQGNPDDVRCEQCKKIHERGYRGAWPAARDATNADLRMP